MKKLIQIGSIAVVLLASTALAPVIPFHQHWRVASVVQQEAKHLDDNTKADLAKTVIDLGKKYQLDPLLILAVIKTESNFRMQARSNRGALGLMQVKPIAVRDIADEIEVKPGKHRELLSDWQFNLTAGVHYFASLLRRFDGNIKKALMAYNSGPTFVARNYRNRDVPNSGYQRKVLEIYAKF